MNAAPTAASAEQTGTAGRPLPIIAVTMGDAAGIGPEVVVPALLARDILRGCRPVVIGDAERLREAARILGVACDIVPSSTAPPRPSSRPAASTSSTSDCSRPTCPGARCRRRPATPRTSTSGSPPNSP